jgi:hypothetical protein
MNVPFEVAKSIADAHHGLPTTEDGWFSSPSQNYDAFNATSITPEQAAQVASRYAGGGGGGGGGSPDMQRIMSAAQIFGGGGQQQPVAAQPAVQAPVQPADPVPQTGADKIDTPPGKALGTELEKAEKQKGMDKDTAYNAATLGNIMRAAKAEGVSFDDILATVAAGGDSNDYEISRIFATSKGLGVRQGGGHTAADLRNAMKDTRALKAANLKPDRVSAYFRSPQTAQGGVRRFNPETGTIE